MNIRSTVYPNDPLPNKWLWLKFIYQLSDEVSRQLEELEKRQVKAADVHFCQLNNMLS